MCIRDSPWINEAPPHTSADPKPALAAFGAATQALAGTLFERQLGLGETGDDSIEAYRFRRADGGTVLAAWTTTGDRLGRRGVEPITTTLTVPVEGLAPWTGRLAVTDHLGRTRILGDGSEEDVPVDVGPAPVYIRAAAAP